MVRHIDILREIGEVTLVSARRRPVGAGWAQERIRQVKADGMKICFREDYIRNGPLQWLGMAYAICCKLFGLERAFGFRNPYHLTAFPVSWWRQVTKSADLCVLNYSYWAHLRCACRSVMVLLDLWSTHMWGAVERELEALKEFDCVFVISQDEQHLLEKHGITSVVWCPPRVEQEQFPLTSLVGLVGSGNRFNREGLRWLESAEGKVPYVRVYGALARYARGSSMEAVGIYADTLQPYRDCGIMLIPTVQGMGMQIKCVEALATGRAIVSRRGAMRGIPQSDSAWLEVDTAEEMLRTAQQLSENAALREALAATARSYYKKWLDADAIRERVAGAYRGLLKQSGKI